MGTEYEQFNEHARRINDIGATLALLSWDQEVFLPAKGTASRARHKATLAAIHHERVVSTELGGLIDILQERELTEVEAANLREMKRTRERAVKVPKRLVVELTETGSLGQQAWAQAREKNDWPLFAPLLKKMVDLKREEAEAVGYTGEPYDALLDEYEPGARVAELEILFSELRKALVDLLGKINQAPNPPVREIFERSFPVSAQEKLGRRLLQDIGFDFEAGRLDVSTHPFTEGISPTDVRITARYSENDLGMGLYANLHEGGHALYEMGLPAEHEGLPIGCPVSLGVHESQSRLWENCVGRSRAFFTYCRPLLQELFPEQLGSYSADDLFRAANVVSRSLIRVEADEVTYNLHIILRLEIERALLRGDIQVDDLPAVWREKMSSYLDVEVPDDSQGALQDIHWAFGLFGYFPTYTLGNLYAAQFYDAAAMALDDLDGQVARGEFDPLLQWLRQHIHQVGSLLPAEQLCQKVTGRQLSIEPFVEYLSGKYGAIYGF